MEGRNRDQMEGAGVRLSSHGIEARLTSGEQEKSNVQEGEWTEEDEQLKAGRSFEQRGMTAVGCQFPTARRRNSDSAIWSV